MVNLQALDAILQRLRLWPRVPCHIYCSYTLVEGAGRTEKPQDTGCFHGPAGKELLQKHNKRHQSPQCIPCLGQSAKALAHLKKPS